MKIKISTRADAPATHLFSEIAAARFLGDRDIILLVPGGPGGNHTVYNHIREDLFKFFDLILFDPRGCGNSDPSDPQFCTLENYINDIEAIRAHFNLTNMILMGGSYGAMASLGYSIKYQTHIKKLILIAGSPSYRFIETAQRNLKARGTIDQVSIAENLWNGTFKNAEHFKEYYKIMAPLYLAGQQKSSHVTPVTKPNVSYNVDVTNFGFSDFLKKFDFEPDLAKITCETLILSGENDWINDPIHARLMADKIPKNKLVIFENCGHFIWEDQRDRFFEVVFGFLKKS